MLILIARGLNHGLVKYARIGEHPLSHSLTRIWIHAVWATKARIPLLIPSIESRVHAMLRKQLNDLGCLVIFINGMPDHVHCLFMLSSQLSIAETIKHIKGGSSYEINKWEAMPDKFAWQSGYSAYSVSESALSITRDYILNQKQHHKIVQPVV
jgi:putative transposase